LEWPSWEDVSRTLLLRDYNTRIVVIGTTTLGIAAGIVGVFMLLRKRSLLGDVVSQILQHASGIDMPEHRRFLAAYQKRWNDYPRLGSIVGYASMMSLAAGIRKAGSTDTEKLIAAFEGLKVDTPFGPMTYRPEDNQSTMGAFVGATTVRDGKGVMKDYRYVDGASVLPNAQETRKLRPVD